MARGELRECERVLAGQELLLPRLDLLLPRRGERLHDAVDERANMRLGLRDPFRRDQDRVGSIWRRSGSSGGAVVSQGEDVLILVRLALFNDRKLRHFRRRLCVSVVLNPCFSSSSLSLSRLVGYAPCGARV